MELIGVPEGADLELDVQLEGVAEGVLVTASVVAPLTGECARCLDPFTSSTRVRLQELFTRDPDHAGPDGYLLTGDLVDLEPALRDALVLELPLSPLCAEECQGLCPECGIRLADAGAGHGHEGDAGVWAALRDFQVADGAWRDDAAGPDARQDAEAPGGPPAREAAKKEH